MAEHVRPVGQRLTCQKLGRRSPDPPGELAAIEPSVVGQELQQTQVLSPQLATEEEVAPKAAVEILHQGTGSNRLFAQLADRLTDLPEATSEFLTQSSFLDPTPAIAVGAAEHLEHATKNLGRTLKLDGQPIQIGIELLGESNEVVSPVLERSTDRLELVRTQRNTSPELGRHEVTEFAPLGVTRTGHGEDVMAQPTQ
jgi:hypothetical protein